MRDLRAESTCSGRFWNVDHIDTCFLQRYLELYPLTAVLVVCVLYSAGSILPPLVGSAKSAILAKKRSSEAPPLLSDDSGFSYGTESTTVSRAASVDQMPVGDAEIERPKDRSDQSVYIMVRGKSIADKFRLTCELILAGGDILFALLAWTDSLVADKYLKYAPNVPALFFVLSVYVFLLVFYRLASISTIRPPPGEPFAQCAFLYSLTLSLVTITAYQSYATGARYNVTRLFLAWSVTSLIKWLILFSSPMGDGAARIYMKPGLLPSLEPTSSLLRTMFCCWNLEMIWSARKGSMEFTDVWELEEDAHTYKIIEKFKTNNTSSHLAIRLLKVFWLTVFLNLFYGCVGALLSLVPTVFINLILTYIEDPSGTPHFVAWLYVFGFAFLLLLQNITENQAFYHGRRLSIFYRSVLMGEIYNKALFREVSTQTEAKEETQDQSSEDEDADKDTEFVASNTGAILNLMSVDTFKIAEFCAYLHFLISSPLALVTAIYYLWRVLSWSAFAGVAVMAASIPLNYVIAVRMAAVEKTMMSVSDKRVDKTNEVLSAIRIIKFFAWEQRFANEIYTLRNKELHLIWIHYLWYVLSAIVFYLLPIAFTAASFASYVWLQGRELKSSVAFTALSIFSILRYPLEDISGNISRYTSAKVALDRIDEFLHVNDSPKFTQIVPNAPRGPDSPKLGIEKASFRWDKLDVQAGAFKLRDIDVSFKEGELNVIVGPTGSGKTSLLMALLGEMYLESGRIYSPASVDRSHAKIDPSTGLAESIAYCAQQAWLVNDTVRKNITFSSPFDQARYDQVVEACQLTRDLEILSDGDQTLIGDKGITLSGGQKQRVSLARAMYSNSKYLILDDCLSAVDSHTAEALYNGALTGPLGASRTIILVSHNVALTISQAAFVLVMKDGHITAQGPPSHLSRSGQLGDDDLVLKSAQDSVISRTNSTANLAKGSDAGSRASVAPEEVTHTEEADNLPEEERAVGNIPLSTYVKYFRAVGSPAFWFFFVVVIIANPIGEYCESYWIKQWTSGSSETVTFFRTMSQPLQVTMLPDMDPDTKGKLVFYLSGYAIIGVATGLLATAKELWAYKGSVSGSRHLFEELLEAVIHGRSRFFDSTPIGRVINRFSKDMETIDHDMMPSCMFLIHTVLQLIAVVIVLAFYIPLFFPCMVAVCYVFYLIGSLYLGASRELKRMESTSRSPIFQQFGEILSGAVTIRAYGETKRFSNLNRSAIDLTHRPYFYLWLSNRWLAFWSYGVSSAVTVLSAGFLVWKYRSISGGTAGIVLTYSSQLGDAILWLTRMYSQVAINMNSVERIEEYVGIEQEAAAVIPENRPPSSWPQKGRVAFKDLSLRYGDDLPMVIKNVSFDVDGGQKIGIVGRTGAGKSTIITALFRLLEPAGGSIEIDGIDISTIGLLDLRSKLSIIPQDPTLFNGTVRSNIDPFDEHSDDSIFGSLARVGLVPKGTTSETAGVYLLENTENTNKFMDLSSEVTEGGNNLSQGQRQLVCLARAILRSSRILLLDEATASIDYETDAMLQKTIREEFSDVTILTIAHRLRTIADYDRILVLEKGEVAQFGSPADLLEERGGIFHGMCEKSGELEALVGLANKK